MKHRLITEIITFEIGKVTSITASDYRNPRKTDFISLNIEIAKNLPKLESQIMEVEPSPHSLGLNLNLQDMFVDGYVVACPKSEIKICILGSSW